MPALVGFKAVDKTGSQTPQLYYLLKTNSHYSFPLFKYIYNQAQNTELNKIINNCVLTPFFILSLFPLTRGLWCLL